MPQRTIDIGYRARKISFSCGRHGLLKREIAEAFGRATAARGGVVADLAGTGNTAGAFLGDAWWDFLLRCRTMPGCLGGSDILDVDGSIQACGSAYLKEHPNATYEEIETACFPGKDGQISAHMLSPRHFECAMAKTCQILVEDDYQGVFKPGVHYIELKRDFSNLSGVLEQAMDKSYCEAMAQRCYDDVVGDAGPGNPNTYAWFARHVVGYVANARDYQPGSGMSAAARLGARCACFASRARARVSLGSQGALIRCYNAVCRWAQRHPGMHAWLKRVFKKDFVPLSS